jgi:predicted esterase
MEQKQINFQYNARYFQYGELNQNIKNLIFVIHGYGQQAKYFIKKFESLNNGHNCIIAPEGLSRFYLEGFSGRVGANWMTKEDRLTDIENYIAYLNAIYGNIKSVLSPNINISVLGFSQGSATASRWAASDPFEFQQLILWAGVFPPDMDFDKASIKFSNKKLYYVFGTKDPFLTEERFKEMTQLSQKLNVTPEIIKFDGGHDINKETLDQIFL